MQNTSYVEKKILGKDFFWREKGEQLLGSLDFELTERCNNNCQHCCINLPAADKAARKRELSTAQIKKILKEAYSLGCMRVRFTGGEPLLRKDFSKLYIFARKLGMRVLIFTNATLVTPALVDLFKRIPPLEKIEVTVYGMEKSSYEAATRVAGSFKNAFRGINLLFKHKVPFVVKGAMLPKNIEEVDEFTKWAMSIPWMENRPPSYSMFFDLRCRRDDEEKNRIIRGLRLSKEDGLGFITRNEAGYRKEMKEFCSKFIGPSDARLFSCGSSHGSGCVDAYGMLQPCLSLRHPSVTYDLKKGTLKEAFTVFFPGVRKMMASNPEYLARCAKCFLKGLCEQCPAKSWGEHGTLDTPVEYLCEIGHAQARYLGLLKDNEMGWEVSDWRERVKKI